MRKRHQGSTRQTESVNHRAAGCRELKKQEFLCSEKERTVFTDPKDRQVKHYYQKKKANSKH